MMLTTTAYMSERFNRSNICILEDMGYEVHVVANYEKGNPIDDEIIDSFKAWVEQHHGKCMNIPLTRSPIDQSGFRQSKKMLKEWINAYNYDFIHCHTPMGGVLGRIVAHETNTKVIYTGHGLHFYTGASIVNWLTYYPVEKFLSRWTDLLITINQEDYARVNKKLEAKKTGYIPGVGIDTSVYPKEINHEKFHHELAEEFGFSSDKTILLSVGELNENKNHEVIMRTIAKCEQPNQYIYLICGKGRSQEKLERLIAELHLEEQVKLIGYRTDIKRLCQGCDVFVFPSIREGLSVALMEAVACGTPVIASNARGNGELVEGGENGYICKSNSIDEYLGCLEKIKKLERESVFKNSKRIIANFDKENVDSIMRRYYEDIVK